jgi:S1-C subfamily serine protease
VRKISTDAGIGNSVVTGERAINTLPIGRSRNSGRGPALAETHAPNWCSQLASAFVRIETMHPSLRAARPFGVWVFAAALLAPARTLASTDGSPAQSPVVGAQPADIDNLVVKVFSTMRYPDPYRPWAKASPQEVTGSGVVIEGRRILTNAHVVLYASDIQVQADQAGDKISASIEYIATGIDLAVLKLDDDSFFDTRPGLPRAASLPQIKDSVLVYGFPTGGASLSITKGIVSRIEFARYQPSTSGLRIQIDAAINPGNSGGPAVVGDRMIGLAFSRLGGSAENIGYIIPNEEIELFLGAVARGQVEEKPALFDEWQTLENTALRAYLALPKSAHGVVVSRPYHTDASYPLKTWDVITRIGPTPIDDQGMIPLRPDLRLSFLYDVQKIARAGRVPVTVIRGGKEVALSVPTVSRRRLLIPDLMGTYPSYFIYGPTVFSTATKQFIDPIENNGQLVYGLAGMGVPLVTRRGDEPAFPGEELVVIASPFFPHKLVEGYVSHTANVVKSVNGIPIRNLRHLVEVLRDCRDRFVNVDFFGRDVSRLVFERAPTLAATEEILNDNGIRAQGSSDLMAVWSAKP